MMRCQKYCLLAALWLLVGVAATRLHAAPRIGDFALLDQYGDFYRLSYYKDAKALALAAFPPSENKALIDAYQAVAKKFQGEEFIFVAVRTGAIQDRETLRKRLSDAGVTIPVLLDDSESIAELLGLTRAGEVLLIDPALQRVLFRGPVGPALVVALEQRAANKTVAPALVETPGPPLPISKARQDWRNPHAVSYSEDIAPLLIKHCLSCHRSGGVAPFAIDSWGVALGWAPMIKEVLLTKRMPPGQIDPAIGRFKNGRTLSSNEIATIVRWIDAGAHRDGDRDPLAEIVKSDDRWAFGEPDYVVELPPQTVPAMGPLDFFELVVPIGLPKDKWLRASQFMPGDKRVLHHAELFIAPTQSKEIRSAGRMPPSSNALPPYYSANDPDTATFSPFVPGDEPMPWPDNTGGTIAKNAALVVQLHYAAMGREVRDESRLGLWFHDDATPPQDRMAIECACLAPARWKTIPPRAANFKAQATLTLERDAYLYSVLPRMHYRGSAIRLDAEFPSGEVEPLLSVANYNYNWQMNYQFLAPKFFPAGTKLIASARYDNSSRNTFNPDPSQEVAWGRESFNEELAVVFQLKYVN